ncbi:hypothetical protein [Synechococcus sp. RS9916]|uniref:hypothetical protein n=1 Tax=Synechococcus sp. RS9916 TaxID=221359 RepID=UPI0000E547FD|nr:hypothetical protein [Synechococcus sp. RS9916]EAU72846.1 hypothetical protein RS9916_39961 [Synechococcus sp. RS9916]
MLEALAHQHLKHLLQRDQSTWPHHLTLSRLIARGLRRRDQALFQLVPGSQEQWWLGVLVPLCLQSRRAVLVLEEPLQKRLLQLELPRLRDAGFKLACWTAETPPEGDQLWVLSTARLVQAHQRGLLNADHQLVIPEAEHFSQRLREALSITIGPGDWEQLRQAHPCADAALLDLHERLSRRLFSQAPRCDAQVRLDGSELQALNDLVRMLGPLPDPWPKLLDTHGDRWVSWAALDHRLLQWQWHLDVLEPLQELQTLLQGQPNLLISANGQADQLQQELEATGVELDVCVHLREPSLLEPLPLFAPRRQPLPNSEIFAEHLLDQARRLILGRAGLTVVLLNDDALRHRLTSELAGEFGSRVIHETTGPDSNGVICCRWEWWHHHHHQLPLPEQLIVALLPLASLESPLTAARVEALKRQGRDWFRELLLPEALSQLAPAVSPLRRNGGRLAILDGRVRSRSWGEQVLTALQPWTPLQRLLPQ